MSGRLRWLIVVLASILAGLSSCMKNGGYDTEVFDWSSRAPGDGVFIVNEGNFMYGNASLTYYDAGTTEFSTEVFYRANGEKLGDVAQSMSIYNDRGYIVVNNSGVIFIVDINNCYVLGSVDGLVSPRYVQLLGDTKAYVTDLYAGRVTIFNPKTGYVTGEIETPGHDGTEMMAQWGQYVFVCCWSYDNCLLVIDTATDSVVGEIVVGVQPNSIAVDKNGKLWVLTDGGYEGNPYGWEEPTLTRIDAATRSIEWQFTFSKSNSPSELAINGDGDTLYYINDGVWKMSVDADDLPQQPFIESLGTKYYGLAVNPYNSEVYVADAIDYVQAGIVYRYSADGALIDSFRAGITPGAFCFK